MNLVIMDFVRTIGRTESIVGELAYTVEQWRRKSKRSRLQGGL
jgi:hypothetical protein